MKTVIVTGAGRGLGLSITKRLLADGYVVAATSRTLSPELGALFGQYSQQGAFYPYDMVDAEGLHEFVNRITTTHGHVYGLVNNAAIGVDGVLATMHNSDIQRLIQINCIAPMILTKYVIRSMMLGRGGRIVNISSIVAATGFSGLSIYGASKAAMVGFMRSLAREVGRVGITVNAVAPGFMETDMTAGLNTEKLDSIMRRSPLRKLASVEDVAGGVSYFLGPDGGVITGTVLTIDAGSTA